MNKSIKQKEKEHQKIRIDGFEELIALLDSTCLYFWQYTSRHNKTQLSNHIPLKPKILIGYSTPAYGGLKVLLKDQKTRTENAQGDMDARVREAFSIPKGWPQIVANNSSITRVLRYYIGRNFRSNNGYSFIPQTHNGKKEKRTQINSRYLCVMDCMFAISLTNLNFLISYITRVTKLLTVSLQKHVLLITSLINIVLTNEFDTVSLR